LLMALVLLGAAPARAAIVLGGGTAATGGEVKLRVSGLTDLFFGADITVRYDPAFLSFLRVDAVSFPLSATDNVGMPSPLVDVLLTVTPNTVVTGLDYFDLVFMTGGAGGATQVQLLAGGFFAFQDPIDPNDQVVEDILQNIIASVNVLPVANAVPVGNTLGLVLPGVVMVAMWRRRARRPARSAMAELPAA